MPQSRQLVAIMFTDIVGYTSLMGNDEQHAFTLLNKNRQLQKPIIGEFDGRWIKEIGDGTMASFNTVSDAVRAAIKIQEACNAAQDFQLRVGIHQGEVVFENDDVFGDAVNIAARIQAAAVPGSIFISEAVNHNIINKKEIVTQFVKEEKLKNVGQPVRMYQVLFAGSKIVEPEKPVTAVIENSIAVLPFANMSSDPEQEYFSDGISEEIINMLAQVPDLKVIARTSCFAFKGKNLDVKMIGEQLKVSHILEGSVRKAGNKLRITAQLINVADGFHLYSEKFDRELEDIFAIQDEISLAILEAIKIKLISDKKGTVLKRYTDNTEAYALYLQGRFHNNKYTPDGFKKAIEYFESAIAIDSNYAIAYSEKAFCYMNLASLNWAPADQCLTLAKQAAVKSLELDDQIAESHLAVARIELHFEYKIREAELEFKKAIVINPNNAEVCIQLGFCAALLGNNNEAMEYADKAINLDPFSLLNLAYIGAIYFIVRDHEKTLALGKRLVNMAPNFPEGYLFVGAHKILLNRISEAIPEWEKAVSLYPDIRNLSHLGWVYGASGDKTKALQIIEKIKNMQGTQSGNSDIGRVYASIGEWDTAFQYFDKAIEDHENFILWAVKIDFMNMQIDTNDPRVRTLFQRLGFSL